VTVGPSRFRLGTVSGVTSRHFVDCAESVSFGDYSTLAGQRSQIWTHGYVHEWVGKDRYRVDGKITIGDNVYIGTGVCITAGVTIADRISVAPFLSVTRSLTEPGLYVAPALVHVPRTPEQRRSNLPLLAPGQLIETVYWKDGGGSNALAETRPRRSEAVSDDDAVQVSKRTVIDP
jgi:hypothetical protein